MMIAARNAFLMGAKLPYDAEVEYIESTGTQWIDTGVPGNTTPGTAVAMDITVVNPSATQFIFGSRTSADGRFGLACASSKDFTFGYRTDHWFVVTPADKLHCHFTVSAQSKSCVVGGVAVSASNSLIDTNLSMYLFSRNYNGEAGQNFTGRIWACSIVQGGVLVRDFIPVRVGSGSSAVGYLYDRANPTGGPQGNGLYGNAGTGAFVIGPDK